ncbi:type I restriction-modification system subunit M [Acinetobacter variabilis]|uniref:type I restriction-modification system subunit M n=1 Tax=Acinetobacter variabilis TaxID=70346 RepID=UPI0021D2B884|nr:class I SAM-dependent DNA methyltransferase [Acinetobacter variabilis]MCU4364959.1 type I restriction-modification system subunit M [Acinetobacter variabilis]MCU4374942.1 type I restriction-modification system subunit M [Acinetobacter variabilis]
MVITPNNNDTVLANFIWKNADDLRGDFPHTQFGRIILPFTLLRRLECGLEKNKHQVLAAYEQFKDQDLALDAILKNASQRPYYNVSNYSLATLGGNKTKANLQDYISKFSENVRKIFEGFKFSQIIEELDAANLLLLISSNFAKIDLHPAVVPDRTMSNVYEHLIAKFGAEVGTGSEDFMTPHDVVHLATTLLLHPDNELFEQNLGLVRTLYDMTCGTGGFLSDMMNHVETYKDKYKVAPVLVPHGQEIQPETHAVALGNMLLKRLETDPSRDLSANIKLGSTLSNDQYEGKRFHYQCANPPYGMKWDKDSKAVKAEQKLGFAGRFGAGVPKSSDGSMLFLQNLVAKLETPENGGGRGAIVLSGSPLFNGKANSGESNIRRWLLENDYIEAIIALPTEIFFRTGITTYIWLISNRKPSHRQGKVQLIDASGLGSSMRKNEGNKRTYLDDDSIAEITRIYADFEESEISKIFDYTEFGYRQVQVKRPLRMDFHFNNDKKALLKSHKDFVKLNESDQNEVLNFIDQINDVPKSFTWFESEFIAHLPIKKVSKAFKEALINVFGEKNPDAEIITLNGEVLFDSELNDSESIPLNQDIHEYMAKEVLPHAPDAVIDEKVVDAQDGKVGLVGYEINFNRYFYKFEQPRHPNETLAEIKELSAEVAQLLGEI